MGPNAIAVIGSLNIDFITRTPRMPEGGETLTANSFQQGFGGKGANQAVACARLSSPDTKVLMAGNVGDDSLGTAYFEALSKEGINADGVRRVEGEATGVANIIVEDGIGENRILFSPNANYVYSEKYDEKWDMVPEGAAVCVFQLEIPTRVVLHNMHQAREKGKHIMFNPAPALVIPDSAYHDIDTLIMNESEARLLSQDKTNTDLSPLLARFLELGVKDAVIITLGGDGVMYATRSGKQGRVPAMKVKVADTTAAGDTFLGAYAAKKAKHVSGEFDHEAALNFATLAASKTVEKKGAMAAIPYLKEIS